MEGNESARTQLSQAEERQLIALAQAGDGAAMERMVVQYLPLARAAGGQRYAQSIAEDATAAAMEELLVGHFLELMVLAEAELLISVLALPLYMLVLLLQVVEAELLGIVILIHLL